MTSLTHDYTIVYNTPVKSCVPLVYYMYMLFTPTCKTGLVVAYSCKRNLLHLPWRYWVIPKGLIKWVWLVKVRSVYQSPSRGAFTPPNLSFRYNCKINGYKLCMDKYYTDRLKSAGYVCMYGRVLGYIVSSPALWDAVLHQSWSRIY